MSITHARCCLAAAVALLSLAAPPVQAQDVPTLPSPPPVQEGVPLNAAPASAVSIDPDSGELKLPIEGQLPYSRWTHHAAERPEDAIVLVRYGGSGAAKTTATGLVVRCDGFVLVPRQIRDAVRTGGSAQVMVRSADGETLNAPLPAPAYHHPYTHASVPYALIKINDHHIRSLPLLAAKNVKSGVPVSIVWATPDNDGVHTVISSMKGQVGSAGPTRETFSLAVVGDADSIPTGAIAVDTDSGAALGFVTQNGSQPLLNTFARFHFIASEVGLAQDRGAVRLGDRPGTLPTGTGEMVWVPGGPVPLDGEVGQSFAQKYKTTVACTPGFWMAVQPVTNGEYRKWLGSATALRGVPFGWSPSEFQPLVQRREDRPVCGVIPQDAIAFAQAHQSRLPTEVEWRRASYVRDPAWAEEMNQNWDRAGQQLDVLYERQRRRVAELIAMAQENARQRIAQGKRGFRIDPKANVILASTPDMTEDTMSIQRFVNEFLKGQWAWGQVTPIDAFRQDVSIFGVRNVLINAPELVLARDQETLYAPKRYTARIDPDLTQFGWAEVPQGTSDAGVSQTLGADGKPQTTVWMYSGFVWAGANEVSSMNTLKEMLIGSFMVRYWRGGTASWQGTVSVVGTDEVEAGIVPTTVLPQLTKTIQACLQTNIRPGFRCAR